MTKQKALMLSIFRSELCKGEHRTADELLAFARERMPGISRATVYNNLKALEEEGFKYHPYMRRRMSLLRLSKMFEE